MKMKWDSGGLYNTDGQFWKRIMSHSIQFKVSVVRHEKMRRIDGDCCFIELQNQDHPPTSTSSTQCCCACLRPPSSTFFVRESWRDTGGGLFLGFSWFIAVKAEGLTRRQGGCTHNASNECQSCIVLKGNFNPMMYPDFGGLYHSYGCTWSNS